MKKLFSILFIVLMVFSFSACSKKENKSNQKTSSKQTTQAVELQEEDLVKYAAEKLGVPDNDNITYKLSEKLYWEPAQVYYKDISFYENGNVVASAALNLANGELLKNIYFYESAEE